MEEKKKIKIDEVLNFYKKIGFDTKDKRKNFLDKQVKIMEMGEDSKEFCYYCNIEEDR